MANLLKGVPVAKAVCDGLLPRVEELKKNGIRPTLSMVRVGERADDLSYERGALKRCESVGIDVRQFVLPSDCSQEELMATITHINEDSGIHGCLMFRPLPQGLDERAACEALDPAKDVDGITQGSLFGVFAGQRVGFPPCTAEACLALLDYYGYELEGANVVVVGRSLVIGKPVSLMLQARNATVTMCHTKTRDLNAVCRSAELLVVAAGHPNTIEAQSVSGDQVVVDVGINWDETAGKLCGDVAFDEVESLVGSITPVPGGVGSVTTAMLVKHVVEAAERTA